MDPPTTIVGIGRLTYIPAVQYAELDQVYLSAPTTDDAMPDGKPVTHELRLASDADSYISWVVGAYYYDEKSINVRPSARRLATS